MNQVIKCNERVTFTIMHIITHLYHRRSSTSRYHQYCNDCNFFLFCNVVKFPGPFLFSKPPSSVFFFYSVHNSSEGSSAYPCPQLASQNTLAGFTHLHRCFHRFFPILYMLIAYIDVVFFQTPYLLSVHFQQFRSKPWKRFNRLMFPEFVCIGRSSYARTSQPTRIN